MDRPPLNFVMRPGPETELRYYPWVVIRFRCLHYARHADARTAACAAKFGHKATFASLIKRFRGGCQWADERLRKPQKYGHKCGGYCPDLYQTRPPDLPPSLSGLTVIDGGKADLLSAQPARLESRRRVGDAGNE